MLRQWGFMFWGEEAVKHPSLSQLRSRLHMAVRRTLCFLHKQEAKRAMHVRLLSLPLGGSSIGVIPMWNSSGHFSHRAGGAFSSAFPPPSAFWSLIFSSLLLCMFLAAPAGPGGGGGGRACCWAMSCSISCCQGRPLPGRGMCILCSLPSQQWEAPG